MTLKRILTSTLLLIALSVFAGTAQADDFSFFVGAALPGTAKHDGAEIPLNNSVMYGLRYGFDLMPILGLEHTIALSHNFLASDAVNCPLPGAGGTSGCHPMWEESKGFLYNSNLTFGYQLDQRTIPFLTAGVGLIHQYGDRNLPVGTRFAFNYGGGVKFPNLAGPVGARIDLRGYRAGVFSRKVNMFEVSLGLMISLWQ